MNLGNVISVSSNSNNLCMALKSSGVKSHEGFY
jgi:hypothetical protein